MTTIAFHYESMTIAVDSRRTDGGIIVSDSVNKILSVRNKSEKVVKFILCGSVVDFDVLIDVFFGATRISKIDAFGFAIENGNVYSISINEEGEIHKDLCEHNDSNGSGHAYALAAMDFGCSAKDAVKYAMKRDIYTGGRIRTIKVK